MSKCGSLTRPTQQGDPLSVHWPPSLPIISGRRGARHRHSQLGLRPHPTLSPHNVDWNSQLDVRDCDPALRASGRPRIMVVSSAVKLSDPVKVTPSPCSIAGFEAEVTITTFCLYLRSVCLSVSLSHSICLKFRDPCFSST